MKTWSRGGKGAKEAGREAAEGGKGKPPKAGPAARAAGAGMERKRRGKGSGETEIKTPEKHRRNGRKHRHKGQKHRHRGTRKLAYIRKKQYLCNVNNTDTFNSPKLTAERITRPQKQ